MANPSLAAPIRQRAHYQSGKSKSDRTRRVDAPAPAIPGRVPDAEIDAGAAPGPDARAEISSRCAGPHRAAIPSKRDECDRASGSKWDRANLRARQHEA